MTSGERSADLTVGRVGDVLGDGGGSREEHEGEPSLGVAGGERTRVADHVLERGGIGGTVFAGWESTCCLRLRIARPGCRRSFLRHWNEGNGNIGDADEVDECEHGGGRRDMVAGFAADFVYVAGVSGVQRGVFVGGGGQLR